jgi:hypothetical protein
MRVTKEAPVNTEFEESREVVPVPVAKGLTLESRSLAVQLQQSEFQARLEWAYTHPRNIHRAMEAMVVMATMSEEAAASMSYDVPRGGKIIAGQSIRFAEVAKQAWKHGNSNAYVISINREEKFVVVQGTYYDFESDNGGDCTVQRSIQDRNGKIFTDDMINLTCNAACAIAKRNAILEGIPRAAWMPAWEAARRKAAGGVEGFAKKRQEVLKHFMQTGIAPDRVLSALGVRSEAALTGEHITTLRGMWSALQNGEATLDDLFPSIKVAVPVEPSSDAPPKKRKTLEDLGEEDEVQEAAKGGLDILTTKEKEDREKAIEEARDSGRQGYHRGLIDVPMRYRNDPELNAAWTEEYEATEREHAKAAEDDDEDTKGAA